MFIVFLTIWFIGAVHRRESFYQLKSCGGGGGCEFRSRSIDVLCIPATIHRMSQTTQPPEVCAAA